MRPVSLSSGCAAVNRVGAAAGPLIWAGVKPRSQVPSGELRASLHIPTAGTSASCTPAARAPARTAELSCCRCHKTEAAAVHATQMAEAAEPSSTFDSMPAGLGDVGRPATETSPAAVAVAAASVAAAQGSEPEAAAAAAAAAAVHVDASHSSASASASEHDVKPKPPTLQPSAAGAEPAAAESSGPGDAEPPAPGPAENTIDPPADQASPRQAVHRPRATGQRAGTAGGASTAPAAEGGAQSVPYYRWAKPRRLLDRPDFLQELPVPEGQSSNVFSFLGAKEPHEGKFYVHPRDYTRFLSDYYFAFRNGYQLFLAEKYFHYPFRYFAELDFPWDLPLDVVQAVSRRLIDMVTCTVQRFYRCAAPPSCLVSMRTPYKVHLNFPLVITTEPMAHMCRDEVVARCREELGGSYALDWERIVDFPHGSFRLLGSSKTRVMDGDPAWVADKAYYPVRWSEEGGGVWQPYGISHQLLCQASIFPQPYQLREFEGSALFLEMAYRDMDAYRAKIEERRRRRQGLRALQAGALDPATAAVAAAGRSGEQRGPPPKLGACAVRLHAQEDGSVKLAIRVRKWAQRADRGARPAEGAVDADAPAGVPDNAEPWSE